MMEANPGGVRPTIGHLVGGNPQFDGWPRWDSYTHQSVYEDWLYRAWRGGLRLMVMLAVNNESMCNLVRKAPGRTCSDMEAVDYQILAAKNMQTYIDEKWGGPGMGWYRIVKTPDEAQAVIDAGKLAVVLGIEVDYLFGSYLPASLTRTEQVRYQLDKYYNLGVRHIFPIHFSDNAFGGASFDKPLQYDPNLSPPEFVAGILQAPYKIITEGTSAYKYRGGRRNVQGLTHLGKFLITEMMARGMIIDVDHMSYRSRSDTLDIAEANNYPVVSSRTGFVEISNGEKRHEGQLLPIEIDRIRALGGMVAIIPNQGKFDQINIYDSGIVGKTVVKHTCGHSSETVVQAYLYALSKMQGGLVGIGTDCNAFTGGPGPRFGRETCPGGGGPSGHPNKVIYPFVADASGVLLNRSVVGQKTFDFNIDGLAHVGMLPDLIADFKALGLTDADLAPLLNSAEAYVRVWKKAERTKLRY